MKVWLRREIPDVIRLLDKGDGVHEDQIARTLDQDQEEVTSTLMLLEVEGIVRQRSNIGVGCRVYSV